MTERAARRALAPVAVVLAISLALLLSAAPEPDTPNEEPAASRPQVVAAEGQVRPVRRTPAVPTRDPHGHDTPAGASARHEARLSAGTFVAALLRYQVGTVRQTWPAMLRQSATETLVRRLTRRPPRQIQEAAPLRGNLGSLEVHGPQHGRIRVSAIVSYGNTLRSLIDLELRRRADRWRVTSLYR